MGAQVKVRALAEVFGDFGRRHVGDEFEVDESQAGSPAFERLEALVPAKPAKQAKQPKSADSGDSVL